MSLCCQWTRVDHLQRPPQTTRGRLTNPPESLLLSWSNRSYQTSEYHCHRAGSKEKKRRCPFFASLKSVQHTPSFIHHQTLDGFRYDTTIPDLWMCLSPWTKSHPNPLTHPSGHPLSCSINDCREPPKRWTDGENNPESSNRRYHEANWTYCTISVLKKNPRLKPTWTQEVSRNWAIFIKY